MNWVHEQSVTPLPERFSTKPLAFNLRVTSRRARGAGGAFLGCG
jgi:hypothetical protein